MDIVIENGGFALSFSLFLYHRYCKNNRLALSSRNPDSPRFRRITFWNDTQGDTILFLRVHQTVGRLLRPFYLRYRSERAQMRRDVKYTHGRAGIISVTFVVCEI